MNDAPEAKAYLILTVYPDGPPTMGIFSEANPTALQPSRHIVMATATGADYGNAVAAMYRRMVHDNLLHPWLKFMVR